MAVVLRTSESTPVPLPEEVGLYKPERSLSGPENQIRRMIAVMNAPATGNPGEHYAVSPRLSEESFDATTPVQVTLYRRVQ